MENINNVVNLKKAEIEKIIEQKKYLKEPIIKNDKYFASRAFSSSWS